MVVEWTGGYDVDGDGESSCMEWDEPVTKTMIHVAASSECRIFLCLLDRPCESEFGHLPRRAQAWAWEANRTKETPSSQAEVWRCRR